MYSVIHFMVLHLRQLSKEKQNNYDSDSEKTSLLRRRLFVKMRGYDYL